MEELLSSETNFYGKFFFVHLLVLASSGTLLSFWFQQATIYGLLHTQRKLSEVFFPGKDSFRPLEYLKNKFLRPERCNQNCEEVNFYSKLKMSFAMGVIVAFSIADFGAFSGWYRKYLSGIVPDGMIDLTILSLCFISLIRLVPIAMLSIFLEQLNLVLDNFNCQLKYFLKTRSKTNCSTALTKVNGAYSAIVNFHETMTSFLSLPLFLSHVDLFFNALNNTAYGTGHFGESFSSFLIWSTVLFAIHWIVQAHMADSVSIKVRSISALCC